MICNNKEALLDPFVRVFKARLDSAYRLLEGFGVDNQLRVKCHLDMLYRFMEIQDIRIKADLYCNLDPKTVDDTINLIESATQDFSFTDGFTSFESEFYYTITRTLVDCVIINANVENFQ